MTDRCEPRPSLRHARRASAFGRHALVIATLAVTLAVALTACGTAGSGGDRGGHDDGAKSPDPNEFASAGLLLTGANVVRGDGKALWRRLNLTLGGFLDINTVVADELNTMAANRGNTTVFVQLVAAPTAEYDAAAAGVFFPLTGQLTPGGGSSPECSDGADNDGDGKVDYPDDPDCGSPDGESEGG